MRCCVILLNWNGWRNTIECLESVFRITGQDFCVVVCDNFSSDNSLEKIRQWARGEMRAESANPQLAYLSSPPVNKPIPYIELTREEAESVRPRRESRLVLIQTGANLGFAGGNNVGLRYALGQADCQFFWMLNNDTVVEPGALTAMVRYLEQVPNCGLCGSLNRAYYAPEEVQSEGGKQYSRWTARAYSPAVYNTEESLAYSAPIDFVSGASMLARRNFLEHVGLMEESYFLFFEEMDWATRAKGKFSLGYARDSVIFHKEGGSIGSHPDRMKRSLTSEAYLARNRVLFTRRFYPWALPTVIAATLFAAAHRLYRGDLRRAKTILTFMLLGLRQPRRGTEHGSEKSLP
jgi:GT2 family glycosyltransferase